MDSLRPVVFGQTELSCAGVVHWIKFLRRRQARSSRLSSWVRITRVPSVKTALPSVGDPTYSLPATFTRDRQHPIMGIGLWRLPPAIYSPWIPIGWYSVMLGRGISKNEENYVVFQDVGGDFFRAISSGTDHVCALREDGTAVCWGDNQDGRASPPSETFTAISACSDHTCALRQDGTPVCWGQPDPKVDYGQVAPPEGEGFLAISSGTCHTCALSQNGTLVCWGASRRDGVTYSSSRIHQSGSGIADAPEEERFLTISAGGAHSCALRVDGSPVCRGIGYRDQ